MKYLLILLSLVLASTSFADPRLVRSDASPKWLAAVGKFQYKNYDGKWKQCSMPLVSNHPDRSSNIVMTAGHCTIAWRVANRKFEIGDHRVTFWTNSGEAIRDLKVVEVLEYEHSPGDYAILRLSRTIPNHTIKPLVHTREDGRNMLRDEEYIQAFQPWATAAGYSVDEIMGDKGKYLTYHVGCYLNGGMSYQKDSRCTSYGGASGGPIAVTVDRSLSEWTDNTTLGTEYLLVGLIKGGMNGDNTRSYWTPNTYYTKKLVLILEKYFGKSDVW